jgi:hypothetical protein
MRYDKPINIKITPSYRIKEPLTEEEQQTHFETTTRLGGMVDGSSLDVKQLSSGGRMDWGMYTNQDYINQTTCVQLMRIWTCQMVTQMVNNKAYVNEIGDEPKFNITDEEKEVFFGIMKKLNMGLNDSLEKSSESMVTNRKIKKVEL